jgi:hypothetical protein
VSAKNCFHRLSIFVISITEKLRAILEDTDGGEATHSKSSRSRSAVVSHSMLLAQQKLSMLKALEESSLQASILPSIVPAAIVDCDDEDDDRARAPRATSSAADSTSPVFIHLKFMAKTKQQVGVLRDLRFILQPATHNPSRLRAHSFHFRWSWP